MCPLLTSNWPHREQQPSVRYPDASHWSSLCGALEFSGAALIGGVLGSAPQCPLWVPPLAITMALAHIPKGVTCTLEEKGI